MREEENGEGGGGILPSALFYRHISKFISHNELKYAKSGTIRVAFICTVNVKRGANLLEMGVSVN